MNLYDNQKFPSEGGVFTGLVVDHKISEGRILYRVRIPSLHYQDVKDEHLPWIPAEMSPGLGQLGQPAGALDRGQLVNVRKYTGQGGSGYGSIVSIFQPIGA